MKRLLIQKPDKNKKNKKKKATFRLQQDGHAGQAHAAALHDERNPARISFCAISGAYYAHMH